MDSESDFNARAKDWDANPMRVERAAAVARAIRSEIKIKEKTKALEYGCGTGLLSFALYPYLSEITLADSSQGMLHVLVSKIMRNGGMNMTPLLLDLTSDPLPSARFDLIYTLMTMHHILPVEIVLKAFYDLLLPGGKLCVADIDQEDGTFHDASFIGHHGFDRSDFGACLESIGFREVRFMTVYTIFKMIQGSLRPYPVFLATCMRPE